MKETKPGGPVMRIRVRWQPGEWTVVKRVALPGKTLRGHRELREGEAASGMWFEAVTGDDEVVYRQVMADPTAPHAEVFDEKGGMSQVDVARTEAVFDVLVPDLPKAKTVRLFSTATGKEMRSGRETVVPVAVFPLRDADVGGKEG